MSSSPVRTAMWCVPVAQNSVFRLEVQVAGNLTVLGTYNFEYLCSGEKWAMEVKQNPTLSFWIVLRAPESAKTFTYKPYVRTSDKDFLYESSGNWITKGLNHAASIVGAEVTVFVELRIQRADDNWDAVLCVGDTKFYAHKTVLSFAPPTFCSVFEREFREKNQQEIPVNVDGTDARHFEAFLQCLYPGGSEPKAEFLVPLVTLADFYNVKPVSDKCVGMLKVLPHVNNVEKLRVAFKVNATSLEDTVITSLSKTDINELIAAGFKDLGDERWQKIVAKCHSMIQ